MDGAKNKNSKIERKKNKKLGNVDILCNRSGFFAHLFFATTVSVNETNVRVFGVKFSLNFL